MYKRKFIFKKYMRRYSYTKFGTFFAPLGILYFKVTNKL